MKRYTLHIAAVVAVAAVVGLAVYAFAEVEETGRPAGYDSTEEVAPAQPQEDGADMVEPQESVTGVRNGESFGPVAPDFALPTLNGETFSLADHKGDVVVLNFWATWCAPCREEIPGFIEMQEELEEGVQFVGVSLDEEGFEVVEPFAREMGINYPLVVDDGTVAAQYGAGYALPTTFLINRRGQVVAHIPGMLPEEVLRPMLEELIQEGRT